MVDTILNFTMFQKYMTPLKCTLFSKFNSEEKIDIFFSTTWCRDRLFTSENPNDILKFYDTFSNRDELIQWMKERPKGRAEIIEVEGDKEIIVVIPTADFNGKYAKECRENIFKGLHIIFVESGFPKDPYFNYAHNCNIGIKKAMEYNPKWIVLSNDDMVRVDSPDKLRESLSKINDNYDIVFALVNGIMEETGISTRTKRRSIAISLFKRERRILLALEKRFGMKLVFFEPFYFKNLLFSEKIKFKNIGPFGIFSNRFIKENNSLFDETYVNGIEDYDLCLDAHLNKRVLGSIDYTIGSPRSQSLGTGFGRILRDQVNRIYFSSKFSDKLLDLTLQK
ncbi:MAG: hypothetical protein QW478_06900 [Candidatus Micrarchaeaceae archaeon]